MDRSLCTVVEDEWLTPGGEGSVSAEAVALCRREGIVVIPGGCPMWVLGMMNALPRIESGAQYTPTIE
jgi:hypothetical protein